ncbi:MAG: AlpA family phage regulatory protein [Gammaproteobacteria bacterium]|nr:AlpA family phage regulatory protein [Gammaproteobacteria bacterium]MDE0273538.1 AlpA family phage regulatory protein [Gammaproteobacteria bacterium]
MTTPTLLRFPALIGRTGMSESTIRRAVKRGDFPQPVRLSARAIGWRVRDIEQWEESRAPGFLSPDAA